MISTNNTTCSGTLIISTILSKPILQTMLPALEKLNFFQKPLATKAGLLQLNKDKILISGTFGNKIISVYCKEGVDKKDCENLAKETISTIEKFLAIY